MKKMTGVLSAFLGAGLISSITLNVCLFREFKAEKQVRKLEKKENNYVLNIQICQGDCTSIETWNAFIVTEKINSNVTLSINNVL